jgi:hypothetical protein
MATDLSPLKDVLQQQNQILSLLLKQMTDATATLTSEMTALLTTGIIVKPALSAVSQSNAAAPTAPASTSAFTMQGLGATITPIRTGIVLFIISGTIVSAAGTAGNGISYQISTGTGTAPVNGAALTGAQLGTVQTYTNQASVTAADVHEPFSIQAVVTGLSVGSAFWIDLAAKSIATASDISLTNLSITTAEQ